MKATSWFQFPSLNIMSLCTNKCFQFCLPNDSHLMSRKLHKAVKINICEGQQYHSVMALKGLRKCKQVYNNITPAINTSFATASAYQASQKPRLNHRASGYMCCV